MLFLALPCAVWAQPTNDSLKTFTLGEVAVIGRSLDSVNTISIKKIEAFQRLDVGRALNLMPGVSLSNVGPRNESMVYVRGFDLRQVPVFIDGVPVYVPYDGYVDLARFTTFDFSEINVAKGYSSALYGANTLGGAINLVSRKPTRKLELNGASGFLTGGYRTNINIGTKWDKFYFQGGVSKLKRDFYKVSHSFDSVKNENGGKRDNSHRDDTKLSAKVGFTPTKNQEYVLSYIDQRGDKGTPVYAGSDPQNSLLAKPRYWQWPAWNKKSLYLIGNISLNETNYLKLRGYYDKFYNELFSFDDATYTNITRPYAFKSYYNDYTYGGSLEYGTRSIKNSNLRFSANYKRDIHREHNGTEPVRRTEDLTMSVAAEDNIVVFDKLSITPGITYITRKSIQVQGFENNEVINLPASNNSAFNWQVGAQYELSATGFVSASVARKTRFATIKDRYSYRLGTAIPNPDLKPEHSLNYDLSYSNNISSKLKLQTSLFYNAVGDVIQSVNNVQPGLSQLQNKGDAKFYGAEIFVEYQVIKSLTASVNYTYIERKNETDPTVKFTDVPNHKIFGSVQLNPYRTAYLLASVEYNSSRYSTSYGTKASGFAVVNTKAFIPLLKNYLSAEGGVNNIFDRNYALTEGYPEEGRNYFVNIVYKFQIQ